jgi:hypothetical protein
VARPLNATGLAMLHDIPPRLRQAPEFQAVMHCASQEVVLMDAAASLVRDQFNPLRATLLLKAWEALLRTTVEKPGMTVDDRRSVVIALHRKSTRRPTGSDWEASVTDLVGSGWTYQEHDADDPDSPPPYTIRVELPFPPTSDRYAQTEALLRDITPAAWDLIVTWPGGFVLDESRLDQEEFGN